MRRLFPLLTVLALAACKNDCQKICDEMADFADECGTPWEREDLKTCRADQANRNKSKEQREACEDALPGLRDEWTCEDLEDYHSSDDDDDGGDDDGGDDGGGDDGGGDDGGGDDGGGTGGSDSGAR